MVFCQPEASISEAVDVPREVDGVVQRLGSGAPGGNRCEVQDRKRRQRCLLHRSFDVVYRAARPAIAGLRPESPLLLGFGPRQVRSTWNAHRASVEDQPIPVRTGRTCGLVFEAETGFEPA